MPIKTYNCPNPEDFAAGDAYLINGKWHQDIEEPETRLEGKLIEDSIDPPIKFCVDCKHFERSANGFHKCGYTFAKRFNLVTGQPLKQPYEYCSTLRERGSGETNVCGAEAQFFEARS